MVDIDHRQRVIKVKLVYYGPAVGGKTTNLKVLFERAAAARRGQFVSVNSAQDRTILCDLLPLRTGGFRGYDLKVQLLAVPGQPMYAATRRVVLKGADGVVFVANSAEDRWQENLQSLQEMVANLLAQQIDASRIPLVFQYNKRDLPAVIELSALSRALNQRHVPEFPAVASSGEGVLESFASILGLTIEDLCRRYATLQLPPGQTVEAWAKQAVEGMFGGPEAAAPAEDAPPEPAEAVEHLKVRVPTAEDSGRGAAIGSDGRATESLTESYAQASAELGFAVSELREARDLLRVRLDEVQRALELATEDPGKTAVEERLQAILRVLVKAGGATGATLMLFTSEAPQVLALPPLQSDPLSRTTWGAAHVEGARGLTEPQIEEAVQSPELAQALRAGLPSFEAVALVPLRSAERLLGLALLYFGPYAALPPGRRPRAPRLPVPRARGPARGRGRARGRLRRRSVEGALEGVGRRRGLAADTPALGAGAAAAPPPVRRPGAPRWLGRDSRRVVARDLGAGGRAAPAFRLCQPHPPVRGRRAREGPYPRGRGWGRAGRRRRAGARHRGRAQLHDGCARDRPRPRRRGAQRGARDRGPPRGRAGLRPRRRPDAALPGRAHPGLRPAAAAIASGALNPRLP